MGNLQNITQQCFWLLLSSICHWWAEELQTVSSWFYCSLQRLAQISLHQRICFRAHLIAILYQPLCKTCRTDMVKPSETSTFHIIENSISGVDTSAAWVSVQHNMFHCVQSCSARVQSSVKIWKVVRPHISGQLPDIIFVVGNLVYLPTYFFVCGTVKDCSERPQVFSLLISSEKVQYQNCFNEIRQ